MLLARKDSIKDSLGLSGITQKRKALLGSDLLDNDHANACPYGI